MSTCPKCGKPVVSAGDVGAAQRLQKGAAQAPPVSGVRWSDPISPMCVIGPEVGNWRVVQAQGTVADALAAAVTGAYSVPGVASAKQTIMAKWPTPKDCLEQALGPKPEYSDKAQVLARFQQSGVVALVRTMLGMQG